MACAMPALCAALLLVSGCGANDGDSGPGGVTVGEAQALDRAAEMLDQQRLAEQTLPSPVEPKPAER